MKVAGGGHVPDGLGAECLRQFADNSLDLRNEDVNRLPIPLGLECLDTGSNGLDDFFVEEDTFGQGVDEERFVPGIPLSEHFHLASSEGELELEVLHVTVDLVVLSPFVWLLWSLVRPAIVSKGGLPNEGLNGEFLIHLGCAFRNVRPPRP